MAIAVGRVSPQIQSNFLAWATEVKYFAEHREEDAIKYAKELWNKILLEKSSDEIVFQSDVKAPKLE